MGGGRCPCPPPPTSRRRRPCRRGLIPAGPDSSRNRSACASAMPASTRSGSYGSSSVDDELVHADHDPLARHRPAWPPLGGALDLRLLETPLDCRERAARLAILAMSSVAAASISSVIASIAYEPANGSTVLVRSVSASSTCWVRSASRAAFSRRQRDRLVVGVGVQRLGAAEHRASACIVTLARFTSGCCAVSWTPAVWVWNRSICDFGFLAPNSSRMIRPTCGARRETSRPPRAAWCARRRRTTAGARTRRRPGRPASAAATYSFALASVNAISCTGVAPASAMW